MDKEGGFKYKMTEIECCYDLGTCKNKVEYWVTKKNDDVRWWYGFCKDHFNLIIDTNDIELEQLIREKARMHNQIINWEELGYHSKIHVYDKAYGNIKITMAIKEYRKKKLQKYLDKRKKEHEDQNEF